MAHCTVVTDTHSTDNNRPTCHSTDILYNRYASRPPYHSTDVLYNRHNSQPIYLLNDVGQLMHRLNDMAVDRYIGCTMSVEWVSVASAVELDGDRPVKSGEWYVGCTIHRLNDMSVDCCVS
jgi:hypothetical protein